jgi:hypothetical protein
MESNIKSFANFTVIRDERRAEVKLIVEALEHYAYTRAAQHEDSPALLKKKP